MAGRYDAIGPEAEFQPGSGGRVLRNRLGITSVRELERRESAALLIATQQIIDETRVDQRFTASEIRQMHRLWLGEIYEWAGEYRGVNIAKCVFYRSWTVIPGHRGQRRGFGGERRRFFSGVHDELMARRFHSGRRQLSVSAFGIL
jgi:hypothetical protein